MVWPCDVGFGTIASAQTLLYQLYQGRACVKVISLNELKFMFGNSVPGREEPLQRDLLCGVSVHVRACGAGVAGFCGKP